MSVSQPQLAKFLRLTFCVVLFELSAGSHGMDRSPMEAGILESEFVFTNAPFASCHASTLAEAHGHLVCAWFGGTGEGHKDVGIWVARHEDGKWTEPQEVATGTQADGSREPCWNPVLFQSKTGKLLLFYKVGPSPRTWWGMLTTSGDGGASWATPTRLPDGILGPIKNKPIVLSDGDLLCPSSTENSGWRVHFERTADLGTTWTTTEPVNDGQRVGAIQPTILLLEGGGLKALCRTRQGRIYETISHDNGHSWSVLVETALPNPNSGIDAVTLQNGRHFLVYNHTTRGRSPLNLAVSDQGADWQAALVLESGPGEYSYPAIIQTTDGLVHISYTWKRLRIKHVVVDPKQLKLRPIAAGQWPR